MMSQPHFVAYMITTQEMYVGLYNLCWAYAHKVSCLPAALVNAATQETIIQMNVININVNNINTINKTQRPHCLSQTDLQQGQSPSLRVLLPVFLP